jgi:hypothetical protein
MKRIDDFEMRLHLDRPAVVCTAAVSLLTAVAAVAPSTALADDTLPTQLPTVASLADAATTAATDAVAAAPLPDVTADAGAAPGLDAAPVVDAPASTPSETVPAAPSGDTVTQGPAPIADGASQSGSAGDITPPTADTAADTPPAAPQPKPSTASTTPTAPPASASSSANVNVSVRIDSPGDNGPVSQVNVAGGAVAPLSTAGTPETTPVTPPPGTTKQSSAPAPVPQPSSGASDTWYWNWDCLGTAPISAISPTGSGTDSFPTSWTWIWNCGDKFSQYQPETPSGYPQINTNIAIRISSPGNDGSVTQVNVGAGITIPVAAPVHGAPFPPSPVNLPPPLDTALGAVSAALDPVLAATPFVDTTDITAVHDPVEASDASAGPVSATPFAAPVAPIGEPTTRANPLGPRAGGFRTFRIPLAPVVGFAPTTASAVDAAWRASSPASSDGSKTTARPPEATPRPRVSRVPAKAPVISVSGVSASAAAGGTGGSSGSGLPLLLALPFVAALLDLARRVAIEHATWPSGHRRRVPERPG